jgi:16S rRNA (cytosine967-C5)-methyltransferase
MPVDVLDPAPGERIADLCSGRGNKAVQIVSRVSDTGNVECVELDPRRASILEERLARSGATCAHVTCGDASVAVQESDADGVLLDAPCSGLGILGRHPEARWRKSAQDGTRLAQVQSSLLEAAATRVRPGGRLVYAVCTTDRRECEGVVDAFLAFRGDFVRESPPERYREFTSPNGDVVVPPGIGGRDGFYISRLRRAALP